jgi:DNA (cytosine-5)-methyltransferase 1
MSIPIISLFCGAGGLDLGFAQQDFQTLLALDADPVAVNTYNSNHSGNVAQVANLVQTSGEDIIRILEKKGSQEVPRGVIGGPPCQSFSTGNAYYKDGDIRHTLPKHYASILKALNEHWQLDFFVFENVRGLTNERHRAEYDGFKALFEDAGFTLFEHLLDAADFGVPQRRIRLFLVGLNTEKHKQWEFQYPCPQEGTPPTVATAISKLPEPVFYKRKLVPESIPHHPNHWAMTPKSVKFENGFLTSGKKRGKSFRVLAWDKPSYTVAYGHNEVHIHPTGKRRLSVYESMLLQGFPTSYKLLGTMTEQFRQVSNAVPPPLANALAGAIRLFLDEDETARIPRAAQMPVQSTML